MFQQTIADELIICGQALHSGVMVEMRLSPLPPDSGVQFGRSDLPGRPRIKAGIDAVVDTKRSTTVGKDGWRIATIEHLMAVFHGLGIDNVLVEVDAEEIPLGDGSGLFFAERILAAGIVSQDAPRRYTVITEPTWVEGTVMRQGEPIKAQLIALPGSPENERLEVSFTFTSDHKATGTQYFHYILDPGSFISEIAPARTIAFRRELDYLRSQGLALGGDENCAVVVGEHGYENELRFPEEIVRHKILDVLGDLYLLGPLSGQLVAIRSGHALDLELARKIEMMSRAKSAAR
jgi:UDP-3-O-[3-hydroxymyristoyl] N-acetylglucosamine deacetylase